PARAPRAARRRARRGADGRAGMGARRPGERQRMRIACAFDHAGFPLKGLVLETLTALGHEPIDLGTNSTDPVDYPDTARAACEAVRAGEAERAVIVCGSGAGVAVAAGKFPGIRAVVAHD